MSDTDSIFADDVELITDAEVLEEEWTPDRILCREDVLAEYTSVFKSVYKGRPPQNAFLYGDTGVGKTAATKFLRENLEQDIKAKNRTAEPGDEINLHVIWINCQNFTKGGESTTSYQVAVGIVNRLRERGQRITGTGHAPQDVYDMMYSELDDLGGTALIVLDEVDKIGDDDTLLYDLPRARDSGYVEDVRIGVIGISNDYTFRKNLSPKVKDSLCETELKFSQYNANELHEIIEARAENALVDGCYDQGVLSLCAGLAYQEASGSARRAIRLLRRAAEFAEEDGVEQITEDHVRRADEDLEYGNIVESLVNQDDEKLYILKAIAHLDEADLTPARTRTVHTAYERVVEAYNEVSGHEPLTQRGMFNHLKKLVMFGFVDTIEYNRGSSGGRWDEHQFSDDVAVEQVKDAFAERDMDWKSIEKRGLKDSEE